jgi:hypothetical protein
MRRELKEVRQWILRGPIGQLVFSLDLAPADVVTGLFTKAATGEIVVTIHQYS